MAANKGKHLISNRFDDDHIRVMIRIHDKMIEKRILNILTAREPVILEIVIEG